MGSWLYPTYSFLVVPSEDCHMHTPCLILCYRELYTPKTLDHFPFSIFLLIHMHSIPSISQTTVESLPSNRTLFVFNYHICFKVLTWNFSVIFSIISAYMLFFSLHMDASGFLEGLFALNQYPFLSIGFTETAHDKLLSFFL